MDIENLERQIQEAFDKDLIKTGLNKKGQLTKNLEVTNEIQLY